MCTVCGCGDDSVDPGQGHAHGHGHHHHHDHDHPHDHAHSHAQGEHHHHHGDHDHSHDHTHDHSHAPAAGSIDFGGGLAGVHVPGLTQARIVQIERDILATNDSHAAENRARFAAAGSFVLNLVSSPGSGKTSLLVKTIADLKDQHPIAVIEGDQQTANDAQRIRATGAPAIQINTGKGCHLDAHMVGHALDQLPEQTGGLLFIENVGNLVCPAGFDLGEAHKVVVLSITEGEDKPLKYPHMFAAAELLLLNKIDLLPHLDFDLAATIEYARRVNPRIEVLTVSAKTGEGMPAFYAWIVKRAAAARAATQAAE
ncbi:hydrogenase nickel incorporation protein HypB [Rhodopseudomonas sp. HC1]|uniref:hydrogenase nickel incorporation protein HypB n=1 Tax=Rhodopseudomonas infernalis TaxID=2897386 RepID=UPI001EE94C34|nr:hydrogenase nickel incorporation protein HypB [Rhodopseudomonas infernalis]MCG6207428.1 hydrogenase nickel incorporation protein HypB [Rhodopseudomonas infernalis]